MKLPMMNIEYMHWPAIRPSDYVVVLSGIRVGEHVYSLPVPVSDGATEVTFPILNTTPCKINTCDIQDEINTNEIRFRRETYTDGVDTVDVWKRVK